jgi:hypothetical protein
MGALVHGRAAHGFTVLPNIKHGSNLTIEALHRVLVREYNLENGALFTQKKLYLQLDNTSKQCKSQYVLGFLGLLCGWHVFTEVILGFLPVGHTHEDIDQFFSRVALYLRKHDATSRIGFRECIENAYKAKWAGKVCTDDIVSAANVSDWIKPYLAPMDSRKEGPERRIGISKFHQFKFSLLQGVVIMQVREWCGDREAPWTGLVPESTHHVVFRDEVPSPGQFAHECPPAQRSTLPSNPEYMKKNKAGKVISNHTSKTRSGVEKIIANRGITGPAREDLHECLRLLESQEPLNFHWDMDMYTKHSAARDRERGPPQAQPPRNEDEASAARKPGPPPARPLRNEGEASASSNDDNTGEDEPERKQLHFSSGDEDSTEEVLPEDKDGFAPAPLVVGNIHLVRLDEGISWGLAK